MKGFIYIDPSYNIILSVYVTLTSRCIVICGASILLPHFCHLMLCLADVTQMFLSYYIVT